MVIEAFKNEIIPLEDGSYFQYFEEKDFDLIERPEKFIELQDELGRYNKNFSATFNFKKW